MHSSLSFSFLLPPGEEHELSQRLLLGENADLSNPQAKLWNMSCNVFSELLACQCLSHVLWHRSNGGGGQRGYGSLGSWKSPGSGVCIFLSLFLMWLWCAACRILAPPVRDWAQPWKLRVLTTGPPQEFLHLYFCNTFWLQWNRWLACSGWESNPTLVTLWLPCRNGSPSSGLCGPAFKEHYYLGPVLFLLQWSFLL